MVCYISFKESLLNRDQDKTSFNKVMKPAICIYFLSWDMGLIRPPRHSERVYTSESQKDTEKKNPSGKYKRIKRLVIFRKRKVKAQRIDMTSSRSQTELVTEPGTVAKSFGLIVQRSFHHTLLSPWCAICFLAQVTQMCSLAKWTVQGSKRLFSSQNLPCIRPNRGVVFLVTLP